MGNYDYVTKKTQAKLEEYAKRGDPLSEQYARTTGTLEMQVVMLLNYIELTFGQDALNEARQRIE